MTPTALASRLHACDLGQAYAARIDRLDRLWDHNPRADFALWYWGKAMGQKGRRDERFREFCEKALEPYKALFVDHDSQGVARSIVASKPRGPAEWASIAVFAVARAREYATKKYPWVAAQGVSNWLCCASAALAMSNGGDGAKSFNAEQMRQAEVLRGMFENPLVSSPEKTMLSQSSTPVTGTRAN